MTVDKFLIGASSAGHQVEGNNIYSDFWAMEQMTYSQFDEPSLDAVDHYRRFEEDIELMAKAGLNAYRFSIEWARVEPAKGEFDEEAITHYRKVLEACKLHKIEPIVTLHHFASPKWLIEEGGWENPETAERFAIYTGYVVKHLGEYMGYVCTINEVNMGKQIAAIAKKFKAMMEQKAKTESLQVGVNLENPFMEKMKKQAQENMEVFGIPQPQIFLGERTEVGEEVIRLAHEKAREVIRSLKPNLKVGLTLSLHDIQAIEGGEELAQKEWKSEFLDYLPWMVGDDFIGVQNYTRSVFGANGQEAVPPEKQATQMGHEFYPQGLGHVIERVAKESDLPILVTENGIATDDDALRISYIEQALEGVKVAQDKGISVFGYLHWSILDNFEWQKGFSKTFGLIAVDRKTQERIPKNSLAFLGSYMKE